MLESANLGGPISLAVTMPMALAGNNIRYGVRGQNLSWICLKVVSDSAVSETSAAWWRRMQSCKINY